MKFKYWREWHTGSAMCILFLFHYNICRRIQRSNRQKETKTNDNKKGGKRRRETIDSPHDEYPKDYDLQQEKDNLKKKIKIENKEESKNNETMLDFGEKTLIVQDNTRMTGSRNRLRGENNVKFTATFSPEKQFKEDDDQIDEEGELDSSRALITKKQSSTTPISKGDELG
jgi:hypothetical protein